MATMNVATMNGLSPARRELLRRCQRLNFGRIEGLIVRGGEPCFDPPPRIVREIKIGGRNDARPEIDCGDFSLKADVVEFFEHLDRIANGVVEMIEVRAGLPCRFTIEEAAA